MLNPAKFFAVCESYVMTQGQCTLLLLHRSMTTRTHTCLPCWGSPMNFIAPLTSFWIEYWPGSWYAQFTSTHHNFSLHTREQV